MNVAVYEGILQSSASHFLKTLEVKATSQIVEIVCFSRSAVGFEAPHILRFAFTFDDFVLKVFLAAMAAMPRELQVKTLEGDDLTVEVVPTTTIKELKAKLFGKKHCEDPIECKILKVKVLADGLLVDDDQTVDSAGAVACRIGSECDLLQKRS